MALNLIKVLTVKGQVFVGVSQIVCITKEDPAALESLTKIILTGGNIIICSDSPQSVAELANRRPPDGS